MSYQAVQWALDDAPMLRTPKGLPDTTARAVLVARAERADEFGRDTHAAITDVIWRTGFDARTIQRAQERLEAAGLLIPDGTTQWGTPRWNLGMNLKRDPEERAQMEAAAEAKKAAEADRVRAYRRKQKEPRTDGESVRTDGESVRTDTRSVRTDSDAVRTDAAPPKPPVNLPGTPREPSSEPPLGGTLPPNPLRPQSPSAPGTGIESSLSSAVQEPPQPETATHDRAHEAPPGPGPNLRLVTNLDRQPTSKGFGFCLACHAEGQVTLAVDEIAGAACAHHLRSAS
ncbi:hypothetical protein [Micromonospora endolithica]|uniref:Uncharacterized protein n=1 Tax=Micromonospora endolithica TaxID=230091 RepID=A0A3A9YRM7_9ACTN|nr:hypothetical protein [Micromonospora endolithica]RKN38469.1 hypothetical protein D7223_31185 [Micromonospora endolithica]TWJ23108.1 hypothetical protein JD76_03237 [Micromonospora endolithica]